VNPASQAGCVFTGNYTYDDSLVQVAADPFDLTQLPGNRWRAARSILARSQPSQLGDESASRSPDTSQASAPTAISLLGIDAHTRLRPRRFRRDLSNRSWRFRLFPRANLFDRSYQDALGYPALGRELRVGMNYRFGGHN